MTKLYSKNTWVDEVLAGDERYDIAEDGGTPIESNVQISLATGVTQAGTAADAARMNNIEDGIDAIDDRLDDLDTEVDAGPIDYSAISTIVGWSSFTVKLIYYKKVGNLVFVDFNLQGTSNSATTTFTMPYTAISVISFDFALVRSQDNGAALTSPHGVITSGTATVSLGPNSTTFGWTASGTKVVRGQFWYLTP